MTQFQKPLVQANDCIQYPLAMQCAICFSHLRVASLALATFFARALLPVAIAFARNASLPFRCHVCCQGLLLAAKILPFNLPPVLLPPPSICQCFLPPMLPLHLPPSVFSIHVALQIATAIAIAIAFALKVAIFVAIKFGCLIEHCSWILDNTDGFTHRRFYTQTLLHADAFYTRTHAFTHKRFYTQTRWHTNAFTHRRFYAQMRFTHAHALSHTNAFTHRRVHTQTLLHTDAFTHRRFYTQTLLHADAFYTRRHAFTHKRFYTQTPLHTDTFTQTKASIAIFPQFLTSKVHFVQKGYD